MNSLLSPAGVELEIAKLERLAKKWKRKKIKVKPQDISGCCGSNSVGRGRGGLDYIDGNYNG